MAHFAELDNDNKVLRVIVVGNADITDEQGNESEQKGIEFCQSLLGGTWLQTSYNTYGGVHVNGGTPFRKNYASVGGEYDQTKDAFIPRKPDGDGWILDEQTCLWRNPVLEEAIANTQLGVVRV